ncbi:MAG: hypothetical protein QOD73_2476 [Solirubrobacteraceae bacterium]|jgi:uncharacterized protein YegP (UPF0339 family)|nr:hypothetical protein [Solirubrobacteraceae bacterium]
MATTRRKTTPALAGAAEAGTTPWTGALRFDVYEENSGRHRWRLMSGDGHDLATSTASFATHAEAERAAGENRA